MRIQYQTKKWEKEFRELNAVWRKGEFTAQKKLEKKIEFFENMLPSKRNYFMFYNNIQLKYMIIADNYYLMDSDNRQYIDYLYLSGITGVIANLFDTEEARKNRHITDAINVVRDFDSSILQLIAVDQPLPKCIRDMDYIYMHLLKKDFDKVEVLLQKLSSECNPKSPYTPWFTETERVCIRAIMEKDEEGLQEELIKQIREYRKAPVGYSTFIDTYAIAMLKLARQNGMNCNIDVIEIPKVFFDEKGCQIDTKKLKVPFWEEAIVELRKKGIIYED